MKERVARVVVKRLKNGDVVGIGSGSTVELALRVLKERIDNEKLDISGIPTSHRTAILAAEAGVRVLSSLSRVEIDWAFDGADEVDPEFNMIKGRGGAMVNEKIVARRAKKVVVIVSEDKLVDLLGKNFPVPVEVVPEAVQLAEAGLLHLGSRKVELRSAVNKYGPEITEHNNLILDAWFDSITPDLESRIKALTGVVESGLFMSCAHEILVARKTGVWSLTKGPGGVSESLVE